MSKYSGKHGLSKRLLFSTIILAFVYYCIFSAPFILYLLINSIVIGLTLNEFYSLLQNKGLNPNKNIGISLGVLFPLFIYFPGEALVCAFAILLLTFFNYSKEDQYAGIIDSAVTLFGLIYVAMMLAFFSKIRFLSGGAVWIAYIIAVIKLGDAGAYFIGTSFGKKKLFKEISPNKTLEGAIAGIFFSVLTSICFVPFIANVSLLQMASIGLYLAIIGQIGDLTESLIKRECGVKDSGVIPGLGGILDILDSLLFSAPFLYYILKVINI